MLDLCRNGCRIVKTVLPSGMTITLVFTHYEILTERGRNSGVGLAYLEKFAMFESG